MKFSNSVLDTSFHLIISITLVCIKFFHFTRAKPRKREDNRFAYGAQLVREVVIRYSVRKPITSLRPSAIVKRALTGYVFYDKHYAQLMVVIISFHPYKPAVGLLVSSFSR